MKLSTGHNSRSEGDGSKGKGGAKEAEGGLSWSCPPQPAAFHFSLLPVDKSTQPANHLTNLPKSNRLILWNGAASLKELATKLIAQSALD